jgi:diaminopimelate epimerase
MRVAAAPRWTHSRHRHRFTQSAPRILVFMHEVGSGGFGIRYYNADGSRASLCGNASLCTAQSAIRLGLATPGERFHFTSDSGEISAVVTPDGLATIRLAPVEQLQLNASEGATRLASELRIGYAVVGVPHLVVEVADIDAVDVDQRGRELRHGAIRAPAGANVNFVSRLTTGLEVTRARWRMRTFERGVEGETLACGTGAVVMPRATAQQTTRLGL